MIEEEEKQSLTANAEGTDTSPATETVDGNETKSSGGWLSKIPGITSAKASD